MVRGVTAGATGELDGKRYYRGAPQLFLVFGHRKESLVGSMWQIAENEVEVVEVAVQLARGTPMNPRSPRNWEAKVAKVWSRTLQFIIE